MNRLPPTKTASELVCAFVEQFMYLTNNHQAEYTPGAYLQSDLDAFAKNFSTGLEGISPKFLAVDGGNFYELFLLRRAIDQIVLGVVQTVNQSFDYNAESNLDLEYGMTLVTKSQNVTLYQVGDIVQGEDER